MKYNITKNIEIDDNYIIEDENDDIEKNNNNMLIESPQHIILEDNDFNGYYDEVPGCYDLNDEIDDNESLIKKINEIKKIKEKKRKFEPTEESYDMDYIETKNIKSKDLINGK